MSWMEHSPKGRRIERVEGKPGRIQTRGLEIEQLGQMMIDSATVLQSLADGTDGLKGKAADTLRQGVGDVHGTLKEAGELYRPTGPVVYDYGVALATDQPAIDGHVARCETLWEAYVSLPGSLEPRGTGGWFEPEADSPEAAEQAAEDEAKRLAYAAWETEAKGFDDDYDSWESAFEKATDRVGDVLAGKIKDSFWDDLDGFVAGALQVLKWVGIALAIAALVIGGPIVAALAAIVAVATLVLTLYQYSRKDADLLDVGIAAIGVLPIGSLGKLAKGKDGLKGIADDTLGGLLTGPGRSALRTEVSQVIGSGRAAYAFSGSMREGIKNGFSHFARNHGQQGRLVDSIARLFTGKDAAKIGGMTNGAEILVTVWWNQLGRVNQGLSWGTGEGLWPRFFSPAG
ncbi:hypothetical protein [Agrococcus jenensis]|uniref:Uncharacterized protein n=1 Tax=Agrococcus jenensis TaxID=46353 RepID=A0A3N2ASG2_9MICO|nr:hypothetical protein [Agrococcus jenensis]ROR65991.1 hypothetical protein EDD26_1366 [Agrococcus jenensis]